VSTETQAVPLALASILLLRLGLSDDHLLYVQPAMRPWLVAGGVVLATVTGAYVLARWSDRTADLDADACNDDDIAEQGARARDHHAGTIGWLLALPLAAVVVVPMAPLGSFAAARRQAPPSPPPAATGTEPAYPRLPEPVDGAVDMTLSEFVSYALYDTERRLEGKTVRLTGFVTSPSGPDDRLLLTRFALSCCAADAWATSVRLRSLPVAAPPDDTWVTVEGTWRPDPSGHEPETPVIEVDTIRLIPTPSDPYQPFQP
jgi:uncharacterized repeat protein (TIGR03943 family)